MTQLLQIELLQSWNESLPGGLPQKILHRRNPIQASFETRSLWFVFRKNRSQNTQKWRHRAGCLRSTVFYRYSLSFFLVRNIFKTPYRKKTKESSTWTSISTIRRGLLGIYRNYSLFKVCVKSYLVRRTTRLHQIITPTGLKTKELQLVRERRFSHQHRGKGRITECHARDGRM